MAARQKAAGKTAKKGKTTAKQQQASSDIDRRWSILLFGIGILITALSIFPGESGWGWARSYLLFGVFGIGGWLLGPMFMFFGVYVGLQKPLLPVVIKGVLLLFALSGAALVFGKTDFTGLPFGNVLSTLVENGHTSVFSGGLFGLVLGWTLLTVVGRVGARIILVILVIIALMVFTGVSPADIVHFSKSAFERFSAWRGRRKQQAALRAEEQQALETYEADIYEEAPAAAEPQAVPDIQPLEIPVANQRPRRAQIDIDIGPMAASSPGNNQFFDVEIGPGGTFGVEPAASFTGEGTAEEPLLPFNPFSPEPLTGQPEPNPDLLLFKEDDPYANLGGPHSALPNGTLYDVEYVPPPAPAPDFDLFHQAGGAASESSVKPEPQASAITPTIPASQMQTPPTSPSGEGEVADLINKAAAPKQEVSSAVDAEIFSEPFANYQKPSLTLLQNGTPDNAAGAKEEMRRTADQLVGTLSSFGVETRILDISRGPSVTRYEVQPQTGVKISRITSLSDDIALNLAVAGVRIEAPIPGKPAVGIEVPNRHRNTVWMRSLLESTAFAETTSPLSIALGKDIAGDVVVTDLTKMPHLLIAGATGSGKSVCINSTIISFLYKSSPEDVRMILIDPKVVELAEYNGIPHLLIPVVTEPTQAAKALGFAVAEMEKRYHLFAENNVRDITSFNKMAAQNPDVEKVPHIVIVIDELADLMHTAGKDVENYICRIAQKARAAGMHLIVATQRPSVDVITGLIKSNIPSRIAFATSSQVDSRTILDGAGAEKLLGNGDMLFMPLGANKPLRVQGTFVKNSEISKVIKAVKQQGNPQYDDAVIEEMNKIVLSGAAGSADRDADGDDSNDILSDPTFISAVETALEHGQISTSFLQRRLRLGYARAGRIMDQMEQLNIISQPVGSKPREVLITRQQWQEMSMNAAE